MADTPKLESLDIDSLKIATQAIITSYKTPKPKNSDITEYEFFCSQIKPVWDWIYRYLDIEEVKVLLAKAEITTELTKDGEKERVLEICGVLRAKIFKEIKGSDLATIQELTQQLDEAEKNLSSQPDPASQFVARIQKRSAVYSTMASVLSKVEHNIPSTPPQISPELAEVITEAFKDIPKPIQATFHQKIAELTESASTATPENYHKITQEIMDNIEKATGKPFSTSLKKQVLDYFPPPTPITDTEIIKKIAHLESPQAKAEYLQKETASHFTKEEAFAAGTAFTQHDVVATSAVIDALRNFAYKEKLPESQSVSLLQKILPETLNTYSKETTDKLLTQVRSVLPRQTSENISTLTQELIFSKAFAKEVVESSSAPSFLSALTGTTSSTDALTLASKTGLSEITASKLITKVQIETITQTGSSAYVEKVLLSQGHDAATAKDLAGPVLAIITNPDFKSSKDHVIDFLKNVPKPQKTDVSVESIKNQVDQIISQSFPTSSPEYRVFSQFSTVLSRGLASAETAPQTLVLASQMTAHLSPSGFSARAVEQLSPLINVVRGAHAQFKPLTSSASAILESYTGKSSTELTHITNQLVFYQFMYPTGSAEQFQQFINKSIVPKIESLGSSIPDSKVDGLITDLRSNFSKNLLKQSPQQFLETSLFSHLTRAGLTPEQAKTVVPLIDSSLKFSFWMSGHVASGKNLSDTKMAQAAAFGETLKVSLASLVETNPILKQLDLKRFSTGRAFNDLYDVFGNPKVLSPDFLVKLQSPTIYSFSKYISGYIPEPIRPLVAGAAKTLLGTAFMQSEFAKRAGLKDMFTVLASGPTKFRPLGVFSRFDFKNPKRSFDVIHRLTNAQIARNPVALRFKNSFQVPISNAINSLWTKFAGTSIGKAVTAVGAKIASNAAVNSILQTIGSAAPVVGNLIALAVGWLAGEALTKVLDFGIRTFQKIKDHVLPGTVGALLTVGSFMAGVPILPSSLIGIGGAGLTGGIQSAIGGKTIGFGGQAAANTATQFNTIVTAIVTSAISSTLSGAIAAVIAIPMVTAFFLYIITSSALVVPPTVFNTGSGVGFQNNSSCPLSSPRIGTYSYDAAHQEAQGPGNRYHGTNGYWRDVYGNNTNWYCSYHLPSDGISCGPQADSTNYCYSNTPRCVGQRSPVYGYAIDVSSSDFVVSLPQINGQSATWEYDGLVFNCNSAGCPHRFKTTTSPDGNVYTLNFLHMADPTPFSPPSPRTTNYLSGDQIGTLFIQPNNNTHLHLEVQINNEYVKPENYFCN